MPEAKRGDTTDSRAPDGRSDSSGAGGGGHGNGPDNDDRQQTDFARAQRTREVQDAISRAERQAAADDAARQQRDIDRANDTRAVQDSMRAAEQQANNTADNPSDTNNSGGNTQNAGAGTGRGQADSGPRGENRSSDNPSQSASDNNTGNGSVGRRGEDRSSDGPTQSAAAPNPGQSNNGQGGNQSPSQTASDALRGHNQNPQRGDQTAEASNQGPSNPPGEEDHGDNRSPWPSAPPSGGPEQVMLVQSETPEPEASNAGRPIEVDLADLLQEQYAPEELAERSDASAGEEGEGRNLVERLIWGNDDPVDPRLYDMDIDELTALAEQQRYIPSTAISASSLMVADMLKSGAQLLTKHWLAEQFFKAVGATLYARVATSPAFEASNTFHERVLDQPIVDPNPGLLSERMLGDMLPGLASTITGMAAANAAKAAVSSLLAGTALAPVVVPLVALSVGVAVSSKTYTHFDQAWQNYTYDPTDPADLQRFLDNLTPEQQQDYEDNQDLLGLMADDFVRQSIADMDMENLLENGPTLVEPTSPLREPITSEDAIRDITNYLNDVEDGDAVVVAEAPVQSGSPDEAPESASTPTATDPVVVAEATAQPEVPDLFGEDEFIFGDEPIKPTHTPAAEDLGVVDGELVDLSTMQPVNVEPVKIVDVRPHLEPPIAVDASDDVVVDRSNPRGEQDHGDGVPWWLYASLEGRNGSDGDYGGYSNWDGA